MRTNLLHSARARFAATASVVFALVALGGVTALPASAAPATVTITVQDTAQGGLLPNHPITLESQDGSVSSQYTTSSSAEFTATVEEGSYRLVPGGQYVPSAYFTISAGQTAISVPVTKPKIAGSIPAGAANGHTTVGVEIQGTFSSGNTYWYEVASFVVGSSDGTFAYLLQVGTNTYRLNFKPDATVAYLGTITDPVVVDGTVDTVNIGTVALPSAGAIRGAVTDASGGAAIGGATVTASSGGATAGTATTAADGTYLIKLAAAPTTVTIAADAPGYAAATYGAVTLSAGNSYAVSGTDMALTADPIGLTGTTVGGGGDPYSVNTFLYKKDGSGRYAQTPYGSFTNMSAFSFQNLPAGQYRIAFRDTVTDRTLVWSSLTDNGTPVSVANGCYYDFTMSAATGSRVLSSVSLATEQTYPATCANPAYTDSADAAVTGTVTNYADFPHIAFAKLYKAGSGLAGPTLVDTSQLEYPSGSYSLTGVREAGDYFIKIVPYEEDAYLTTLLGDGGYTEWAKDFQTDVDFAANHSFAVDPNTSTGLTGHDVTLVGGALLSGYVRSDFGDSIDAGVILASEADPSDAIYVPLDSYGSFSITLPVGGSYTLLASSTNGDFIEEYWENATDVADAEVIDLTAPGVYGPYNFNLSPSRPSLYGVVNDASDSDPITVHLYQKDTDGLWQPIAEQDSDVDFNQVYFDDLDKGDYRMRFERDGVWLSSTSYSTGTVQNAGAAQAGPTCSVDFAGVTTGFASIIYANFDSANQTPVCAAEPPTKGDVTGRLVSSAATGGVSIANKTVRLFGSSLVFPLTTTTNAQGEFTFPDVNNGTYGLVVVSETHVTGQHDYILSEQHTFEGGADLGTIIATRFGNVTGDIEDWDDATMAGATATVYASQDCGCGDPAEWIPAGVSVEIDSDGHFEAPGITTDGDYAVFIDFDGIYVDAFVEGGTLEPASSFVGTAEQDYTYPAPITLDAAELISITGTAFYGDFPLEGAEVYAEDPLDSNSYVYTEVQADGTYELLVDPNADYLVSVWDDTLQIQYYEGYNYDSDFGGAYTGTIVEVNEDPITGVDFEPIASRFDQFNVRTSTAATAPDPTVDFNDVEVHLYQYVVDGWVEVDTQTAYPVAELASADGGDYRLRFSKDNEWLRVDQTAWENDLPPGDFSDYTDVDACYIEFSDLEHGSSLMVDAVLDPDGAASGCGPEVVVEHFNVDGELDRTDAYANAPISGQAVTLTNSTTGYVLTETTDADGSYAFDDVTAGTYTLSIPSAVGADGYAYVSHTETVVVDENEGLAPIELTRYGNVELEIDNWDSSMAGAIAQAYLEGPAGVWTPVGLTDTVDSTGFFSIPGIAVTGNYRLWVDYPTGFVDGFVPQTYDPTQVAEGVLAAEEDVDDAITAAFVLVSGIARLGAMPVGAAAVTADLGNGNPFATTTASDGSFSVALPAGQTYTVEANKAGLVRAIDTAFVVGFAAVSTVDLEMKYATFLTTVRDATATPLTTATVHLYRQVTGGWQEVASDTWSTTYLWANLSGSYRIRVSDGANWLTLNGSSCVVDYTPAVGGTEYTLAVTATPSTVCAAEPAVVAPPVTPGTSGSGTKKPVTITTTPVTVEAAEVAPTSTPTPTPTPTPAPSETATATPDEPSDVEDCCAPQSAPDLTWVFVLAGILVLLVLAGGAIYLVRRRG